MCGQPENRPAGRMPTLHQSESSKRSLKTAAAVFRLPVPTHSETAETAMLPPAPLARRFAALMYESLMVAAVTAVAGLAAGGLNTVLAVKLPAAQSAAPATTTLILLGAWWLYFKLNWLREGQTLPMRVWQISLADGQGGRPGLRQCRLRFMWGCVLLVFLPLGVYAAAARLAGLPPNAALGLALIWWILPWGYACLDGRRRFLYDLLAGTELADLRPGQPENPQPPASAKQP